MTTSKIYVRHVHTGEIKQVTEEQRETQNKNYWVRVTGDVKPTAPETEPDAPDAIPDGLPTTAWKNAQILAYADREGIDLGEASTKDAMLAALPEQG